MKILHVIPAVAPRYGGPSSSIVDMCRALHDSGASVLIATTDADGGNHLDVPLEVPTTWCGAQAMFFRHQWSEAFKYSAPLRRWLNANVRDWDVVHVHAPLSYSSLAAARAAMRHHVPFIVRPLGTLDSWSMQQKAFRKQILMPFVLRMLRRAAAIHYTSAEEMRDVEGALGLSRGVVIPLGVQFAFLNEAALGDAGRASDRYVLAVSRLHPVKNLESLIDAFCDVKARAVGNGWRLVIAGSGDDQYARMLDERIGQRQAADFVVRRGWVEGKEKRALVRGASLFALTSHHENFGVGLVEAMAAGVPAVVSRGVHLSESIREATAGWVADTSRESIRETLASAMADGNARSARAVRARTLAAQFAWPAVAGRLVDLYERTRATATGLPFGDRVLKPSPEMAKR